MIICAPCRAGFCSSCQGASEPVDGTLGKSCSCTHPVGIIDYIMGMTEAEILAEIHATQARYFEAEAFLKILERSLALKRAHNDKGPPAES